MGRIEQYYLESLFRGAVAAVFHIIPFNDISMIGCIMINIYSTSTISGQVIPERRYHGIGSYRSRNSPVSEVIVISYAKSKETI